MAVSEHFSKWYQDNTKIEFSRSFTNDKNPEELFYRVTLIRPPKNINFNMKRNRNGHWEIEERTHLDPSIIDMEPDFVKAIKENEHVDNLIQSAH